MPESPPAPAAPVILCSANLAALDGRAETLRQRGIRMVAKPFRIGELLDAINEMIGR